MTEKQTRVYNNLMKVTLLAMSQDMPAVPLPQSFIDDILDALEDSDWKDIKDKKPDGKCIAYSSKFGEMLMGYIGESDGSDTGYCADSNTEWLGDVTHWMTLPPPPNMKGEHEE